MRCLVNNLLRFANNRLSCVATKSHGLKAKLFSTCTIFKRCACSVAISMLQQGNFISTEELNSSQSTYVMSSSSDSPTGYNAQFDPPLEKKHECPLCLYALRDPIQTPCGHRFCTSCIKNVLIQDRAKCPLDNEPLRKDEIFPDNFCRREVLSLTVLCSNKEFGCSWKGQLKELEGHDTTCDYTLVTCENKGCDSKVLRMVLQKHLLTECKYRRAVCQLCQQEIVFESEREHYHNDCPEFEISCENKCGQHVKRKDYSYHRTVSCLCIKLECQFAYVGCQFKGMRTELNIHHSDSHIQHTHMLLIYVMSLPHPVASEAKAVLEREKACHSDGVGSASDEYVAMKNQIRDLMSTVDEQNRTISDLHKTSRDMNLRCEEVSRLYEQSRKENELLRQEAMKQSSRISTFDQRHISTQAKVVAIEQKQLVIEKNLAVRDNAFADHDVRLLSLEMTSYDGVLRWKITEFSRRKSEAVAGKRLSIYSPPFYTSRTGYKMCARIYLNGDGLGKNTHQRVTFTLIDQERRRDLNDTFQPDPASSSFQRPVNDMNVASGCPLFVSLDTLLAGRFIKDDTLFVRIAIDTKDLDHL
ncbi:TNF receptor-associated factor 3-like isoform X2 [Corticium candelabrum]|uniref:TNF receptor-associated factor 3-like isoform X2 n=1 Tax=Corticium candelabrum TaxID=121492 RepID=UPI002E253D2E|nr:TNF receptor-associated factor 3-like isoform X2 [Corticium candelabrum]